MKEQGLIGRCARIPGHGELGSDNSDKGKRQSTWKRLINRNIRVEGPLFLPPLAFALAFSVEYIYIAGVIVYEKKAGARTVVNNWPIGL